jgi:Family of unknown function (DUF6328)
MKLEDALKVSLDELRMQMLGAQVLLGFGFQGLFQDGFATVAPFCRSVDAVGLGLMVVAIGLMIAVPCQHRMIECGEATVRIYLTSRRYAEVALLPLAAGIGCNLFVATAQPFGPALGAIISLVVFGIAVLDWYFLGILLRRRWGVRAPETPMKESGTPLHTKIEQMLTESRVILPGVQALLGFQLVVMLTKAFGQLSPSARVAHLVGLVCLVLAIVLLISPAAIHRVTFGGSDDPRLHSLGSVLIAMALFPLAIALSCDLWVGLTRLLGDGRLVLAGAAAGLALLVSMWYVVPLVMRRRLRGQGTRYATG